MHRARFYTVVLALLLFGQFWLFNRLEHDPHRLSIFPWLLGLLAVPVIIVLAVRQRAHSSGEATGGELRRFGWSVLWPASLAFGCFVVFGFRSDSMTLALDAVSRHKGGVHFILAADSASVAGAPSFSPLNSISLDVPGSGSHTIQIAKGSTNRPGDTWAPCSRVHTVSGGFGLFVAAVGARA